VSETVAGAPGGKGEFSLGKKVLIACMVGVACGASPIPYNVLPIVIGPIIAEFGWGRGEILLGLTIFGVLASFLAPTIGRLGDRLGARRVGMASLAAFSFVFALFYFVPGTLWGWYALWALVGLVGIGSTPVIFSRAINLWFVKHRGLALGLMLLGTSVAGFVVPQIARRVVEGMGWREVFPIMALLPLLIALPLTWLWLREPKPEERPAGLTDAAGAVTGVSAKEAVRDRRFWILWVSIAVIAFAYGGAHINMVQILKQHGVGLADAANVMSVVALGILSGRVVTGLLLDRFWAPAVCFPILLMPAVSLMLLMGVSTDLVPLTLAGFLLGFAAGAESDLIAFLAGKYFGMAQFGRIYGLLYLPFGLFSALSPAVWGLVRDRTGSYDPILLVAMGLFVFGAVLLLFLGRYPVLTAIKAEA
jgi:MFS transporter, OFA family, oxalate/formate antiporter